MANTTINERAAAKRLRSAMAAEQSRRRDAEAAVVQAHRNASGPVFSAGLERQERLRRPRIVR